VIWVLAIGAVAGVWWLFDVRWHPVRPCPRCSGSGRNWGSDPRAWGICRRCGGKREVRRWGAGRES
jgi:hypothetical protein